MANFLNVKAALSAAFTLIFIAFGVEASIASAQITYTDIIYPGQTSTEALGINNNGDVVGSYGTGTGFSLIAGTLTSLSFPGSATTTALAINDSQEIAGLYYLSGGAQHGFTLQNNVFTTVDYPGSTLTNVFGMNNAGDIVGLTTFGGKSRGFLRAGSTWSLIDFPNASFTNAYAINDSGQIAGFYKNTAGVNHGFLLASGISGTFTAIDFPGSAETITTGINNLGQLSGRYITNSVTHAYVLRNGVYTTLDPPGDKLATAFKINDSGVVAGYYDKTTTPFMHTGYVTNPLNAPPAPMSASPASGVAPTQAFTYTFTDAQGWQNLKILDILINNSIDGRNACYIAYAPASAGSGSLYLVDDAGNAGGPYSGALLPSAGVVQNSQCSIDAGASSVTASGNTLTLTLSVTFKSAFAGYKAFYLSAVDVANANSGWQALGTWNVPGQSGSGLAASVVPARSATGGRTYTFTFTDPAGWQDISVVNVLVNTVLDGRNACYLAYVPSQQTVYLVPDSGGGLLPGMALSGSGTTNNSQCTISATGSSVSTNGNTLTLNLPIAFNQSNPSFDTNLLIYMAVGTGSSNSGWQTAGSVTVP